MTVAAAAAKAGPYTGNDVTSSFAFSFKVFADADIRVVETVIATGVESDLVLNTNYTVSRNADQDTSPGGTITYKVGGVTTALPSTKKLTIVGDFDYAQPTDIPNGGSFFANIIELAFDRVTLLIKQLKEQSSRALVFPVSDADPTVELPGDRASKYLAFDADGNPVASSGTPAADIVTPFMETVLDDTTAAAARATLGFTKGADVASANALTLGTDGNYFDITGTTAITSIGTLGVGTVIKLHFDDALTLTHHATDLILPGGANITTAAGTEIELVEYATGDWRMTGGVKADGTAWVVATPTAAASKADQETGTSTTTFVSPGRQQYHPSAAKAWANFDGTGTPATRMAYNVSSITDGGAGLMLLNLTTGFSAATFCAVGSSATADVIMECGPTGAAQFKAYTRTAAGGYADYALNCAAAYGDQ